MRSKLLTGNFSSVVLSPIESRILRCMSGTMVTVVGVDAWVLETASAVVMMLTGRERTYGGRT